MAEMSEALLMFLGDEISRRTGLNSMGFIFDHNLEDRTHRVLCRACGTVLLGFSSTELFESSGTPGFIPNIVQDLGDRCRAHTHFCPAHDSERFLGVMPRLTVAHSPDASPESIVPMTIERIYAEGDVHFVCTLCREEVFKLPYRLAKDFTRKQVVDLAGESGRDHALKCKRLHQNKTVAPNPKAIRVIRMGKGK